MNRKEDGVTTYTFRIVVEHDEDRWRAYAPTLEAQGAATWGYTREEALANIRDGNSVEEGPGFGGDQRRIATHPGNHRMLSLVVLGERGRGW